MKNVEATYQRLVTKNFWPLLGETMEVYTDDMLVNSNYKKPLSYCESTI